MKILSISVAAYNMEKLIRQNLDSFVSSPVAKDVEVLVINDGSKDSTADIVAEYEKKYPETVKLVNQENAGPGSTVNRGIEHATGKYFRMVDADDWVDSGFEQYVNALKETDADMVLTDYTEVDNETGATFYKKVEGVQAGALLNFDDVCRNLDLQMHAVTFKTEILKNNNIRVFNGFYTDMQYLMFPAPFVNTVLYVDVNVYMYRVSLAGQSMAAGSMQRNIAMHDAMVFSLIELYNKVKSNRPAVAEYILNKTVSVAGCQLGTLLSFEPDKTRKKDLFDFILKIKNESSDIYGRFAQLKTVRVLNIGGGMLYTLVSKLHRKKIGL